jgi:hypothetical protein
MSCYPLTVPLGVGPPLALNIAVQPVGNLDYTTVESVSLEVQPPGGAPVQTWGASIVGTPTATSLNVAHTFAPSDTTAFGLGNYRIVVLLTVPGGQVWAYYGTGPLQPLLLVVVPVFGGV